MGENKMSRHRKIKLHGENGNLVDQYGCFWTFFTVDYFAEQETGTCQICGEELEEGWLCLDGGDEVCDKHVKVKSP